MNTTVSDLHRINAYLRNAPEACLPLREALGAIAATPRYQQWSHGSLQIEPFLLAPGDGAGPVRDAGLCESSRLRMRINVHAGRVFLTDGVWTPPDVRVFPFCDESATLLDFAERSGWSRSASCILDLAGGAGHSAWSFDRPLQVLLDVNPRALAYAELNRHLNELDPKRYVAQLNDIRGGIVLPQRLGIGSAGLDEILVLANMPFAPSPKRGLMPLTSDGGACAVDLQVATFRALSELSRCLPRRTRIRAIVLGLSPGCAAKNRWLLETEAVRIFGAAQVRWHRVDEPLLRIDGRRAVANPAPTAEALQAITSCTLYHPEPRQRAMTRKAYEALAQAHLLEGHTDLAYGFVTLKVA